MEIAAITFDLWNTLVENADYTGARLAALNEVLGARGMQAAKVEAAHATMHQESWRRWETPPFTYWSVESRLDRVLALLGTSFHDGERERLLLAFEECILDDPPPLHPRAEDVLDAVAREGLKIALISDTGYSPGRVMRRVLEEHGIASRFEIMVFSDETGFHKPHPVMFSTALKVLCVEPARTLHVGDIARTDVAGAKQHGMRAAWIRQPGQDPVALAGVAPDVVLDDLGDVEGLLASRSSGASI